MLRLSPLATVLSIQENLKKIAGWVQEPSQTGIGRRGPLVNQNKTQTHWWHFSTSNSHASSSVRHPILVYYADGEGHRNTFEVESSDAVTTKTGQSTPIVGTAAAAAAPCCPRRSTNRMSRIMSVWPVRRLVHTPVRASQTRTFPSTQAVNTNCIRARE